MFGGGPFERMVSRILEDSQADAQKGGQTPGKLEVDQIDLHVARAFAETIFKSFKRDLDEQLPDFDQNFLLAKKLTGYGKTQRRDMPVINDNQVREFQQRLKDGSLDVERPFAPGTNANNPFPEGLSGAEAEEWLENGLPHKDKGPASDDAVKVSSVKIAAKDLRPIQKQIYFDKSLTATAEFGVASAKAFLQKSLMIMSSDNHIIDGHHRWSSALLIDPRMMMAGVKIDLPIAKLLPLATAYGDAIGNKRNL